MTRIEREKRTVLKLFILKVCAFSLFLLFVFCFLNTKYIEEGECVAIVYYTPLVWHDYALLSFAGGFAFTLSIVLTKGHTGKKWFIVEGVFYAMMVIAICYYGNAFLASIEIDWPHTYHPEPYCNS